MANVTFNVSEGETIDRARMVALLNVGTSDSPEWRPVGKRAAESSIEMDWSNETTQDIYGGVYTTKKKPVKTQPFDPWVLSGGDKAQELIIQLTVVEENAQRLSNMDMLIVHEYIKRGSTEGYFAVRYPNTSIDVTRIGGAGGGNLEIAVSVIYGGERVVGAVSKDESGMVVFTPDVSV